MLLQIKVNGKELPEPVMAVRRVQYLSRLGSFQYEATLPDSLPPWVID